MPPAALGNPDFSNVQSKAVCTWEINSGSRLVWMRRAITVFDHDHRRLGSDSFYAPAYTLRVEVAIPPATHARTWRCVGFDPLSGQILHERTLHLGPQQTSGNGVMRLTLNAFLPYDHIADPHLFFGSNRIFEGDGADRPFNENGPSRTTQIMELPNPFLYPLSPTVFSGPYDYIGLTQQYETSSSLESNRLTLRARNDWTRGAPLKTEWGTAHNLGAGCLVSRLGHTLAVECEMEAPNGVYPEWLDPQIEYRLTLGFDFENSPSVSWTMTGCHKEFPAYEVWAAGQPLLTRYDSGNPFDILFPCEIAVSVNKSGVITVP